MGRGDPEKEVVASRADPLGMLHWSLRRGHRSFFQGHRGGGGGHSGMSPSARLCRLFA